MVRLLRHDISSDWITSPRRITVWTSGGLESAGTGVPLLLLHDGQNIFEPDRAHRPGHSWEVAETAERLVADGMIPPMVIAGIDHAGEDRIREMTPTEGNIEGAGQAARYGRFVVEELVPFLAAEYAVDVRAGRLAMGGSSLGGLVTLAIAQQYPARFGQLLVMSPSLWWDDAVMLDRVKRRRFAPGMRVWLDAGLKEGRLTAVHVRRLRRLLTDQLDAGHVKGVQDPEGDHSEDSWRRRLPQALTWLFGER
jgi:enterochelin esterase-like enzyme